MTAHHHHSLINDEPRYHTHSPREHDAGLHAGDEWTMFGTVCHDEHGFLAKSLLAFSDYWNTHAAPSSQQ